MKKVALFVLATAFMVMISCEIVNKEREPSTTQESDKAPQVNAKEKPLHLSTSDADRAVPNEPIPNPSPTAPNPNPKPDSETSPTQPTLPDVPQPDQKPVTQYDTEALDQAVIDEANHFKKDPKTYRKFVRRDPDGSEVYRMIGMHVIISPNGEEVYLPDEI